MYGGSFRRRADAGQAVLVCRPSAAGAGTMLKAGGAEVVPPLFRSMEGFHGGGATIEAGELAEWC